MILRGEASIFRAGTIRKKERYVRKERRWIKEWWNTRFFHKQLLGLTSGLLTKFTFSRLKVA